MINFKHIQNGIFNINGRTQIINRLESLREDLDNQIHFAVLKVATETAKDLGVDITGLSDFDAVKLVQETLNKIGKEIVCQTDHNWHLGYDGEIKVLVCDKLESEKGEQND